MPKTGLRIHLSRPRSTRNHPFYNIVVSHARSARDHQPIEKLGEFDPVPFKYSQTSGKGITLAKFDNGKEREEGIKRVVWNVKRIEWWCKQGVGISKPVMRLLATAGFKPPPQAKVPSLYQLPPIPSAPPQYSALVSRASNLEPLTPAPSSPDTISRINLSSTSPSAYNLGSQADIESGLGIEEVLGKAKAGIRDLFGPAGEIKDIEDGILEGYPERLPYLTRREKQEMSFIKNWLQNLEPELKAELESIWSKRRVERKILEDGGTEKDCLEEWDRQLRRAENLQLRSQDNEGKLTVEEREAERAKVFSNRFIRRNLILARVKELESGGTNNRLELALLRGVGADWLETKQEKAARISNERFTVWEKASQQWNEEQSINGSAESETLEAQSREPEFQVVEEETAKELSRPQLWEIVLNQWESERIESEREKLLAEEKAEKDRLQMEQKIAEMTRLKAQKAREETLKAAVEQKNGEAETDTQVPEEKTKR